jgi:flagellar M-ring protein FliF
LKHITQLAQAAVGYDAARGDMISVENISFDSAPDTSTSVAERALSTARTLDLPRYGAALLGLLALILLVLRPVSRNIAGLPALPAPGALISVTDEIIEEAPQAFPGIRQPQLQDSVLQRVAAAVTADTAQSARLLHTWLESD